MKWIGGIFLCAVLIAVFMPLSWVTEQPEIGVGAVMNEPLPERMKRNMGQGLSDILSAPVFAKSRKAYQPPQRVERRVERQNPLTNYRYAGQLTVGDSVVFYFLDHTGKRHKVKQGNYLHGWQVVGLKNKAVIFKNNTEEYMMGIKNERR